MKDKILIGVIVALVLSLALNLGTVGTFIYLAVAKTKAHSPPDGLTEKLELTPEQKETIKEKREEMKIKAEPLRRELDGKRSEVIELMKEPELDTARRDELFNEIAEMQIQLEILVFDHMYETAQELTPGQREIFFEQLEHKFHPEDGPRMHRPLHEHKGPGKGFEHGPPPGRGGEFGPPGPPPGYEGEPFAPPETPEGDAGIPPPPGGE